MDDIAVLIPAYKPGRALIELAQLLAQSGFPLIVIVDDGSGPEHRFVFEQVSSIPGIVLLRHAVNLGKGAALKTAINYVLSASHCYAGVVTADADGQHHPDDIKRVAAALRKHPECLILGAREFGPAVPWRSRFGNKLTRWVAKLLLGESLADTQTGLRGMPRAMLASALRIPSNGYEFELDVLITAKHGGFRIREEKIRTIYEPGNRSSHFNPLLDSMRIYFVLLRFSAVSLLTAALDNIIFFLIYSWTGGVFNAQVAGRAGAVLFNYSAARKAVFISNEPHSVVLPKYLTLVAVNGALSYGLIHLISTNLPLGVLWAKPIAEGILFLASFAIQRDFIFSRLSRQGAVTDWEDYYAATPVTAKATRRYTASVLMKLLRRYHPEAKSVVEIGGANSCFLDGILARLRPSEYHVIDTSEYGLQLLQKRTFPESRVLLHRRDVLDRTLELQADIVFSVGVIEHFDAAGTMLAIRRHFELASPGGCVVMSFPTPTVLYRTARAVAEAFGFWRFPDERPLMPDEVLKDIADQGEVLYEKTLWPLVFTQKLIVIRKQAATVTARAAE